ncbi:acetyl-CoA C-acetyltransferase [Desulforhopalus sp. IMCC35007]|uniref:thiolase family protein n=1 Tax=Desulforhopalus sp. IMCC35007 TaxID=2569543 RepID=UPI0010AEDFBF|nr:acetyl-CoA C-acetyltransferase [Desulforhopalus sp. IMCC35007]TKB07469.1 acetyl-CoA C-acetyltransferase [Desulforhopalus sp. IMCC35007]
MEKVFLVSGSRTAVGSFGGSLKSVPAIELGSKVITEVLKKSCLRPKLSHLMEVGRPDALQNHGQLEIERSAHSWDQSAAEIVIDEVIMGNVLQTGQGQNPARQAMIKAGIPKETAAFTINKVCGSGLKAITLAATAIMAGQADAVIAGGMENMSMVPMALPKARWGHRMEVSGSGEVTDLLVYDGLYEIFYGYHMGITAENIASKYGISRLEQDELSVLSHNRALQAIRNGCFKDEIVPILMKSRKGDQVFDTDERPMETNLEKMERLRPVFKKDGSVTAGNASGINDAAAAVLLVSGSKANELGLQPILEIKGFSSAGLDPAYMGLGPVPAIRSVLSRTGIQLSDLDTIELNEAFASQAIACMRELNIPIDLPNQVGSGISLGHPIGCTGARQVVTGMHQMVQNDLNMGLFSMCIGGGMGMAMIAERVG